MYFAYLYFKGIEVVGLLKTKKVAKELQEPESGLPLTYLCIKNDWKVNDLSM